MENKMTIKGRVHIMVACITNIDTDPGSKTGRMWKEYAKESKLVDYLIFVE